MNLNQFSTPARSVVERLTQNGFEAFFVGGCVRDILLGREVHDFDVTTNAHPERVMSLFHSTIPTGLQHGTVTVLDFGEPIEVTTYRIDIGYSDGRHPDAVEFTSQLKDDLSRRDFTINAMAVDGEGNIRDPFGGRNDITDGIIRAVGVPEQRFEEDGLRILRALRFASQLGFRIDSKTLCAMEKCAGTLEKISRERIGMEITKMALSHWWHVSSLLANGPWFLKLGTSFESVMCSFAQLTINNYNFEIWEHSLNEVELPDVRAAITFALWLHIANIRPHDRVLGAFVKAMVLPNRISNYVKKLLLTLQVDPLEWDSRTWRRFLYDFPESVVWAACSIGDFISHDSESRRVQKYHVEYDSQPIFSLRELAISGNDLIHLGLEGREVGAALDQLVTKVLNGEIRNHKDELLKTVRTGQ